MSIYRPYSSASSLIPASTNNDPAVGDVPDHGGLGAPSSTPIGWIDEYGRWVIDGDQAGDLQVGAAVLALLDRDGERMFPPGAQARTELGWAGHPEAGDDLVAGVIYKVLHPTPPTLPYLQRPASSRRAFDEAWAAAEARAAEARAADAAAPRLDVVAAQAAAASSWSFSAALASPEAQSAVMNGGGLGGAAATDRIATTSWREGHEVVARAACGHRAGEVGHYPRTAS